MLICTFLQRSEISRHLQRKQKQKLMKTTIFLVLALIAGKPGFSVLNDSTKTAERAEVIRISEDVFELDYRPVSDKVTVLIKDEENRIIYRETVRDLARFRRPYNLGQLPKGNYSLEIRDGNEVVEKILEHQLTTRYSPIVRVQPMDSTSDQFKLMFVHPVDNRAYVRILDEIGREIYEGTLSGEGSGAIVRLFRLEKLPQSVTFEITTGNHQEVFTY